MADTLDILTPDEALRSVNLPDTHAASDAIEQLNTRVARSIDKHCGAVVVRTVTDELHDAPWNGILRVKYPPIQSVTSVTEYVSGAGTVLTAESVTAAGGYLLDPTEGTLTRRSSWSNSTWYGRIKVTYVAGRYATTSAVSEEWKAGASSVLRVIWQQDAPRWAQRPDLPSDVEDAIVPLTVDYLVRREFASELIDPVGIG